MSCPYASRPRFTSPSFGHLQERCLLQCLAPLVSAEEDGAQRGIGLSQFES